MRDSELFVLVRSLLLPQLQARIGPTVQVKRSMQPTQQAAPNAPVVLLQKVSARRYGHPRRDDVWNAALNTMQHIESVFVETVIQVDGLSYVDPTLTVQLETADIVEIACSIVQSNVFMDGLRRVEVSTLRVSDIRNSYFTNDADQFQASPSFDFTLVHKDATITTAPIAQSIGEAIHRV